MEPCEKVEKPWNETVKAIANKQMLKKASTEDEKIMENNTDDGPSSKCMHGMNQTEAEYSRHIKRSQRASLSQIGPVVLEV